MNEYQAGNVCGWLLFHILFELDAVYPFTWIFPTAGCGGKLLLRVKMKMKNINIWKICLAQLSLL